jgi:hypothetical protein
MDGENVFGNQKLELPEINKEIIRAGMEVTIPVTVNLHHVIIKQSAMNMRIAVHSLSLLERQACDWLKFYQSRLEAGAGTLMDLSQSGLGDSVQIYGGQTHEHVVCNARETAAVWGTACEIADGLLSNMTEQMSMMCHAFNLATGNLATDARPSSSVAHLPVAVTTTAVATAGPAEDWGADMNARLQAAVHMRNSI